MANWVRTVAAASALAASSVATAQSESTPLAWAQHVAPGGISEGYRAVGLGEGSLDASVSSRFRLGWNDYASDQDVYEYVRANLAGLALGPAKVDANVHLRAGFDLDGDVHRQGPDGQYYFWRDILDAERGRQAGALRVYAASVTIRNVVPWASLTAGRSSVSHLTPFLLDGGELAIGREALRLFVYGGRAASYYLSTKGDHAYGAAIESRLTASTRFRAEYLETEIDDVSDDAVAVRLDQGFKVAAVRGSAYGEYRSIDGPSRVSGGISGSLARTRTSLALRCTAQLDDAKGDREAYGFVLNPLTETLGTYGRNELYQLELTQRATSFASVSAGADLKHAHSSGAVSDRSYRRYRLALDLDALPTRGTHLQVAGELWDVDAVAGGADEGRLHGNLRLSQSLGSRLDAWAGSSWQEAKFDQAERRVKQNVRTYYLGAQWSLTNRVKLVADLTLENADVFDDLQTSGLEDNWLAQTILTATL